VRRIVLLAAVLGALALSWWMRGDEEAPPAPQRERQVEPARADPPPPEPVAPSPAVPPEPAPAGAGAALDAAAVPPELAPLTPDASVGLPPSPVADAGTAAAAVEPALPQPVAPSESTPPRPPKDPRFLVRWGKPGLCAEGLDARREALLSRMWPTGAGDATVYSAQPLSPELRAEIASAMVDARAVVTGLVDWSTAAPHPAIYVYDSLDALRSVSCVNGEAIAYYDGAIHLAVGPDTELASVRQTLHHEYVHHVLQQHGIQRPMWLHEGLAMYAAAESWWQDPRLGLKVWIQSNRLPFESMAYAFPHTADRTFALAAYYQSELMVTFVVHERGPQALRTLVRGLSRGQVQPDDAFYSAVGLSSAATAQRWDQFVTGG
jgi:hypothetical protein